MTDLRAQGTSYRQIAERVEKERDLPMDHTTVCRILSGKRSLEPAGDTVDGIRIVRVPD
jgi:intein-encoded DNA endonuclease-like protein